MAKATHAGHCQACGRLQKLPGGRLSLHGYTVTHGFFSGTCRGAKEQPFEESCDLIRDVFLPAARIALANLEAYQAELRKPATEPLAWVRYWYKPEGYAARGSYVWERVTIEQEFHPYADGGSHGITGRLQYWFTDSHGKEHGRKGSDSVRGVAKYEMEGATDAERLLATCTAMDAEYATSHEREAKSLRQYIAYSTERVRTWAPAPLLPLDAKDKEGFDPEAVK